MITNPVPKIKWKLRKPRASREQLHKLAHELEVSPILCALLHQRGMTTYEDMLFFLSPGLRYLPPLETWPELQEAATLITSFVSSGKKIAVWGDYDVDGIASAALLQDFFSLKGVTALTLLPHRIRDGYGLNMAGIEALARDEVKLLITVDCGISNHQEIARARELGMRVVLTDHHLPGRELPEADVVINPKCHDSPHESLAGVGTAFFLAAALNRTLPGTPIDVRILLDLVALGTIADLVPLDATNRILVKNGLLLLSEAKRPGIYALKEAAGFCGTDSVGAGEVGFGLAPRINAAGRLDDPALALELLLCKDMDRARRISGKLNTMNSQRKKTEEEILKQAREQAKQYPRHSGLALFDPRWHPGVLGIVASRLVEEFNRPCLVLTMEDGLIRGSGRSVAEFDLYLGLLTLQDQLCGFGGHSQAAGLSLLPEYLDSLRERFHHAVQEQLGPNLPQKEIELDAELGFDALSADFLQELELLQPFGPQNPRPVFLSPPLRVLDQTLFGKDRHVGFVLSDPDSGLRLRGQFWRQGNSLGQQSLKGKTLTLAYTPSMNTYRNLTSIRLNIREILEIT